MLQTIFADKSLKGKEKTERLSSLLTKEEVTLPELIAFSKSSKEPIQATCIEALEFVTQKNPSYLSREGFYYVTESLTSKTPRRKWESARVIGNTAKYHQSELDQAIIHLLKNTEHLGTVVRWSAAYALAAIFSASTKHQAELREAFESIMRREEKESIKKIYRSAMKNAQ